MMGIFINVQQVGITLDTIQISDMTNVSATAL